MHLPSYLYHAQAILALYKGDVPLAGWLKNYFKAHKKFGSKDRKHIAHLLFCYFRLGNAFSQKPADERFGLALFLCADAPNALLEAYNPQWNAQAGLMPKEKLKVLQQEGEAEKIFPFKTHVSSEIAPGPFSISFLTQPLVYLRLRPGKSQKVKEAFLKNEVPFTTINEHCIALHHQTKADSIISLNTDAVVQDLNSQRVLEVLDAEKLKGKLNVWDCCAASGGKSILVWDAFDQVKLTVTDVRASILHNLRSRLAQAGIHHYKAGVADVSREAPMKEKFDLVICDAPCSGSGTWGRTPEQLHFFTGSKIDHYSQLQKKIVKHAAPHLKSGGQFLYITCSVFEAENEKLVDFIQQTLPLKLHRAAYFKGYDKKADTLFAAAFTAL